ncbi:SUF system NifU family Fe-S cluster assembly protein [Candidatus Saccharibacteria bacterium]|nr:SUF system NifU family Fe-S cluster assembly protein [Candidatus Saccharibacteria bacterium]
MRSVYDEILLAHNLHPAHRAEGALAGKKLVNASCGDELVVWVKVEDGKIVDAKWQGKGCAIALASADLMTEAVMGKSVAEAKAMWAEVEKLLRGDEVDAEKFGEATALGTVARMPARQACAKLAWQALAEL